MKAHAFRLTRGQDLRESIQAYLSAHQIKAAFVASCVGCVSRARLRDASGVTVQEIPEHMEIVSMTGTVSMGRSHLHISLAKKDLSVIGGHLVSGCIVNTTAEIVLCELDGTIFSGAFDPETGYQELVIRTQPERSE